MKQKPKERIYLAGPMTGWPSLNFPAFDKAQFYLEKQGFEVVSPAAMDREAGVDETKYVTSKTISSIWHEAMRRDIVALLTVDAVALLPEWQKSAGANVELTVARALGLRVLEFSCLLTGAWHEAPNARPEQDEDVVQSYTRGYQDGYDNGTMDERALCDN